VVAVLAAHHRVDQDALARSFAEHHDFDRGYGPAVNRLLRLVREGGDWRELAAELFNGQGSWGNGAAMRIAPLGAWYADDPEQATHQAEISAYPTHQHREAVVGAMAVAAAAAFVAGPGGPPSAEALLDGVIALVPRSAVGAGLRRARDMLDYDDAVTVAAVLGCGRRTTAHDTVPFALWSAVRNSATSRAPSGRPRRSAATWTPRAPSSGGSSRWAPRVDHPSGGSSVRSHCRSGLPCACSGWA
jgi:ADP-ribosylglycohydrolase